MTWIKITDDPKTHPPTRDMPFQKVLVCTQSGLRDYASPYELEGSYWVHTPLNAFSDAVKIRYWMPLPPPPKEGE
jgi:hypothetical protein